MYESIIIIPLGGLGSRFSNANYHLPKPLINVLGKPILFWLLDNLSVKSNQLIYIPYNNVLSNYNFEDILRRHYSHLNIQFLKLEKDTDGAAHTMKIALDAIDIPDIPIISIDGDNFYTDDILSKWDKKNGIFYFNDTNQSPIYSYIELEGSCSKVVNIIEKSKISDNACCGVYAFESYKTLLAYCNYILNNKIKDKNEYYLSTVIKQLLVDKYIFTGYQVSNDHYHCLGTPLLVRLFCSKNQRNITKPKRYCFDLDNTLVSFPKIKNDYTTVEPVEKNIKFLKFLKQLGHTIIIYTARRMQTHSSNVGKVLADIGKITFDTLDKFDIPYDEIYFGKPLADYYIDDLAANAYDNLEKITGFYQLEIEPREFNQIESNLNQSYIKKSQNLSSEINYYQNIPEELKHIFPSLISYDPNQQWFEMEL